MPGGGRRRCSAPGSGSALVGWSPARAWSARPRRRAWPSAVAAARRPPAVARPAVGRGAVPRSADQQRSAAIPADQGQHAPARPRSAASGAGPRRLRAAPRRARAGAGRRPAPTGAAAAAGGAACRPGRRRGRADRHLGGRVRRRPRPARPGPRAAVGRSSGSALSSHMITGVERAGPLRRPHRAGGHLVQQRVGVLVQPERRLPLDRRVQRGAEREHVRGGRRVLAAGHLGGQERRACRRSARSG